MHMPTAHRVLSPFDQRKLCQDMIELLVARHRSIYTGVRITYTQSQRDGDAGNVLVTLEGEGADVMAGLLPGVDPAIASKV